MTDTTSTPRALSGVVAVVTGASRGVGKGIALGLGEAGATVIVTGRTRAGSHPAPVAGPSEALPGSIDDTANEVTARGGKGIAFACDHGDDADVERLFAFVRDTAGRIDVLVNNVFAIPEGPLTLPFWELPISSWDTMHRVGLRSHYVASVHAVRLMLATERRVAESAPRGLIVNVSSFGGMHYAINVAYGAGKAAVDRMTRDSARELKAHGIAAVAIYPGIVRTERVVADVDGLAWDLSNAESAVFSGRAVAALASDRNVMDRTGRVLVVAELATDYGFTDEDGSVPKSLRIKERGAAAPNPASK